MNKVMQITGILLMAFGFVGVIAIMGGVASHAKGYTSINELWPAFGFHAACMAPGIYLLGKSRAKKTDA